MGIEFGAIRKILNEMTCWRDTDTEYSAMPESGV